MLWPICPFIETVPIVQEVGWALGPIWTGAENLAANGIRSADRPARPESLSRLTPTWMPSYKQKQARVSEDGFFFKKKVAYHGELHYL